MFKKTKVSDITHRPDSGLKPFLLGLGTLGLGFVLELSWLLPKHDLSVSRSQFDIDVESIRLSGFDTDL